MNKTAKTENLASRRSAPSAFVQGLVAAALGVSVLLSIGCAAEPDSEPGALSGSTAADLILFNGKIATQEPADGVVSAIAIRDALVAAIGTDGEVMNHRGSVTQVIDLGGRTVVPGLNDSHLHLVRGGRFYNTELRWDGVGTLAGALDMVRQQAERTPAGQWVRVIGGWSPHQFAERRMPTIAELNQAAPDTPVFVLFLYSQAFINRAGLDALGITADTAPPPGGRYEIGPDGRPTGVLLAEPNPTILYKTIAALPALTEEQQVNSTRQFYRELNRFGLTSAIDAGGGGHLFPRDYVGTRQLAAAGEMPIRISYYLFPQRPGHEIEDFRDWMSNYEAGANGAELLANGYVLEGGGEFLVWSAGDFENFLAPRPDLGERDYRDDLAKVAQMLVEKGWPLRIHATYDESISRILDVFEAVDREERDAGRAGFGGIRWAIDHAETISPQNIARVKALGGGIAIQSRLAYAGEYFLERYGPDAAANAPPLRRLLDAGIPVGAGTDGTRVGSHNPWPALYWLVTGKTVGGTQLAAPENRLSREEALRLYTQGSAWFSGEEHVKGTLTVGKYADLAVLSADYFAVPEEDIPRIESALTIVGGRPVYGVGEFASLAPWNLKVEPEWSPVVHFGGFSSTDAEGGSSLRSE
jgi:predicted amidohydrolase YtcJ